MSRCPHGALIGPKGWSKENGPLWSHPGRNILENGPVAGHESKKPRFVQRLFRPF